MRCVPYLVRLGTAHALPHTGGHAPILAESGTPHTSCKRMPSGLAWPSLSPKQVCKRKLWANIGRAFDPPKSMTNVSRSSWVGGLVWGWGGSGGREGGEAQVPAAVRMLPQELHAGSKQACFNPTGCVLSLFGFMFPLQLSFHIKKLYERTLLAYEREQQVGGSPASGALLFETGTDLSKLGESQSSANRPHA